MKINRLNLIVKKFLGFGTVGVFITLLSLSLSYFFLAILKTPLFTTYISIYSFTIFISYLLNTKFVFKVDRNIKQTVMYYLTYLSAMVIGIAVLKIYKYLLPLENWMLSYLVVPITMSWNFFISSKILKQKKSKEKK